MDLFRHIAFLLGAVSHAGSGWELSDLPQHWKGYQHQFDISTWFSAWASGLLIAQRNYWILTLETTLKWQRHLWNSFSKQRTHYNRINLIEIFVDFVSSLVHSNTARMLQGFSSWESFICAFTDVHISIHCQSTSVMRALQILRPQASFSLCLYLRCHFNYYFRRQMSANLLAG